jgi:iron(III) transport system substrate-binding protein
MSGTLRFSAFSVALLAVAALAARPLAAADAALIAAAKKEGEVVWYTTLIVNQLVRPLAAAFEKKYGVKVRFARANSTQTALKVLTEAKAGKVQCDVFDGTNTAEVLRKDDLVLKWLPPAAKNYPAHLVDPDGYWIATNVYVLTPAYNKSLIKPGSQPKTYADLLDPGWRGQMTWNGSTSTSGGPGFIGSVLKSMGEARGMDYLRKLAAQKLVNRSASARKVLDQVVSGENAIALQIFNHHAVISANKGAPVDWIPMEPATVVLQVASVARAAPRPNAGKLLLDYMVSDEGQRLFQKANYLPANPKIPAKTPALKPEAGGFKAIYMSPKEVDRDMPRWKKIFDDLFR